MALVRMRRCPDFPKIVHRAPAMAGLGNTLFVSMSSDAADFHVIPAGSTANIQMLSMAHDVLDTSS